MNDDVGDLRPREADALLDLARPRVGVREAAVGFESERQVRDQPLVRFEETELARVLVQPQSARFT